ncbi:MULTISPECIES: PIG-L deacetylase family protein [unclassified Nocardioides]|uniref:PIG-L deacetylase family protein n=1 Tax=unclassified Nocardioides TaxID=2615069 RepID=UPI00360C31C3
MTDLTDLGTLLGVWAHPDDETYLTGGLMAALRDAGHRVVCVTATRGEAADPGGTAGERAALAALRTRELDAALAVLGVDEHHWLDHPDGACSDADPAAAAEKLACLVDEVRPDTVITFGPDGFTGHPDHRAINGWVDRALELAAATPLVLHPVAVEPAVDPELDEDFGVFELGRPRICTPGELALTVPLTGVALDRKVTALLRQESQTAGLVAAVGLDRFGAWVATERFAEPAQSG